MVLPVGARVGGVALHALSQRRDLPQALLARRAGRRRGAPVELLRLGEVAADGRVLAEVAAVARHRLPVPREGLHVLPHLTGERKSVVKGEGEAEGVGTGGSRLLKNK